MDASPEEVAPAADVDIAGDQPSRRWRWVIAAIGGVVVLSVIALSVFLTRPEPTYDDASQERFVTACVADGGDVVRPACECLYASIVEHIPYDRFDEISDQLAADREAGKDLELPDDIAALVPACQIPA